MIYPLYFKPVYKEYIWGGKRLFSELLRKEAPLKTAESWEICDHREGMSVVENGKFAGLTLKELTLLMKEGLLGKEIDSHFPLLIKIIDSEENLSIQVHPDQHFAKMLGGESKSEMWYFLSSGTVLAGVKEGIGKDFFEECLKKKKLPDVLKKYQMNPGESLFIPPGTVHAILAGCLLLEVQENSNTTYRLYDWDRARPLQTQEALQVMHFHSKNEGIAKPRMIKREIGLTWEEVLKNEYFTVERISTSMPWASPRKKHFFEIFFHLEGQGFIKGDDGMEKLLPKRACLCPAAAKTITVLPQTSVQFLRIYK